MGDGKDGKDKGKHKGKGKGNGKGKGKNKGKDKDSAEAEANKEEAVGTTSEQSELHAAARSGCAAKISELLANDEKANLVNSIDQHRRTPLHLAAFFGHTAAVEQLLELGADPAKEAMDGFLPIHFAAQSGHLEVLRAIVRHIGAKGEFGIVKRHVNRIVHKGKKTALHLTLSKDHSECARFLVMKGASTEIKTAQGQTALDLCKDKDLCQDLVEKAVAVKAAAEADGGSDDKEDGHDADQDGTGEDAAEPPAKKRAVGKPGSQVAVPSHSAIGPQPPPAQASELPMPGLPGAALGGRLPAIAGVLQCGPWLLSSIKVGVGEAERSYPPGVSGMADVHWSFSIAEDPKLVDGPVMCLQAHERASDESELRLMFQKSNRRLWHFTHFSEDALLCPTESRCNACGIIVIAETSDGLLVLERRQSSGNDEQLRTAPEVQTITSTDLTASLSEALSSCPALLRGELLPVLSSGRLLGVLDAAGEVSGGHRHHLVFGVRLTATAEEVTSAYSAAGAENRAVVFARCAAVQEPTYGVATADFASLVGEGNSNVDDVLRRALVLLRELRVVGAGGSAA